MPGDSFGTQLKGFRARQGLTRAQLAERSGVSAATIKNWENDVTKPRRRQDLLDVGRALDCSKIELDTLLVSANYPSEYGTNLLDPRDTVQAEHLEVGTLVVSDGLILPPLKRHFVLVRPDRAEKFIGREKLVEEAAAALRPGAVVSLIGVGGIGKTAVAAQVIWRLAPDNDPPPRFPDGVLFVSFYGQPDTRRAMAALLRQMEADEAGGPEEALRRALAGRAYLLYLDGAEEADDLPGLLALRDNNAVLISSRRPRDGYGLALQVPFLPPEDSAALLRAWGGGRAADEAAVTAICELVGNLPLAVRLAGAYLREKQEEAADYLRWLRESGLGALDFGERRRESVVVLLEKSVAPVGEEARQALAAAGRLALEPFGAAPVAAALSADGSGAIDWWYGQGKVRVSAADEAAARRALGELVSYGLLERPGSRYRLAHPLIHGYARERRALEPERLRRLAGYYVALAEEQSARGLPGYLALDAERAHLLRVLAACGAAGLWVEARRLVWAVDEYLEVRGYTLERVEALEAGVAAARASNGRYDEMAFLSSLGLAFADLGRVAEAIEQYEAALAIAREIGDRRGEGADLGNLGIAYRRLGRVAEAIEQYEAALAIAREIGDRRGEGTHLNNLGVAYDWLGDLDRAIDAVRAGAGDRAGDWGPARGRVLPGQPWRWLPAVGPPGRGAGAASAGAGDRAGNRRAQSGSGQSGQPGGRLPGPGRVGGGAAVLAGGAGHS